MWLGGPYQNALFVGCLTRWWCAATVVCKNVKAIIILGQVCLTVPSSSYHKAITQNIGLHEYTVQHGLLYFIASL